ncbi:MAG: hypothetical protein ACPLSM_04390 [Thermosphaera sp.]
MLGYLDIADKLLSKCEKGNYCFWVPTGLIQPYEANGVYGFDCFFYKFLKNPVMGDRLILSFKLPFTALSDISLTHSRGFPVVPDDSKLCSKSEIENYLINTNREFLDKIGQASEKRKVEGQSKGILKRLIFFGGKSSEADILYYRLLTQYRFMNELSSLLGYRNETLNAEVKKAFILYLYESKTSSMYALMDGQELKLLNHSKLLDFEKIGDMLGFLR